MNMCPSNKRKSPPELCLKGQVFFIWTNYQSLEIVKDRISLLGGKVDPFLSRDVTTVLVEDNHLVGSPLPSTNLSIKPTYTANGTVVTSFPYTSSLCSIPSTSRGFNFLAAASSSNSPYRVICYALQWGIQVLGIDQFLTWIEPQVKTAIHLKKKASESVSKLSGCFIKFESFYKNYRPCYKMFNNDPDRLLPLKNANVLVKPDTCNVILDKPIGSKLHFSRVDINSHTVQVRNTNLAAKANDKKLQNNKFKPKEENNYCECCRTHFADLKNHIKSAKHQSFVSNEKNYESVHNIIKMLPTAQEFIEKLQNPSPNPVLMLTNGDSSFCMSTANTPDTIYPVALNMQVRIENVPEVPMMPMDLHIERDTALSVSPSLHLKQAEEMPLPLDLHVKKDMDIKAEPKDVEQETDLFSKIDQVDACKEVDFDGIQPKIEVVDDDIDIMKVDEPPAEVLEDMHCDASNADSLFDKTNTAALAQLCLKNFDSYWLDSLPCEMDDMVFDDIFDIDDSKMKLDNECPEPTGDNFVTSEIAQTPGMVSGISTPNFKTPNNASASFYMNSSVDVKDIKSESINFHESFPSTCKVEKDLKDSLSCQNLTSSFNEPLLENKRQIFSIAAFCSNKIITEPTASCSSKIDIVTPSCSNAISNANTELLFSSDSSDDENGNVLISNVLHMISNNNSDSDLKVDKESSDENSVPGNNLEVITAIPELKNSTDKIKDKLGNCKRTSPSAGFTTLETKVQLEDCKANNLLIQNSSASEMKIDIQNNKSYIPINNETTVEVKHREAINSNETSTKMKPHQNDCVINHPVQNSPSIEKETDFQNSKKSLMSTNVTSFEESTHAIVTPTVTKLQGQNYHENRPLIPNILANEVKINFHNYKNLGPLNKFISNEARTDSCNYEQYSLPSKNNSNEMIDCHEMSMDQIDSSEIRNNYSNSERNSVSLTISSNEVEDSQQIQINKLVSNETKIGNKNHERSSFPLKRNSNKMVAGYQIRKDKLDSNAVRTNCKNFERGLVPVKKSNNEMIDYHQIQMNKLGSREPKISYEKHSGTLTSCNNEITSNNQILFSKLDSNEIKFSNKIYGKELVPLRTNSNEISSGHQIQINKLNTGEMITDYKNCKRTSISMRRNSNEMFGDHASQENLIPSKKLCSDKMNNDKQDALGTFVGVELSSGTISMDSIHCNEEFVRNHSSYETKIPMSNQAIHSTTVKSNTFREMKMKVIPKDISVLEENYEKKSKDATKNLPVLNINICSDKVMHQEEKATSNKITNISYKPSCENTEISAKDIHSQTKICEISGVRKNICSKDLENVKKAFNEVSDLSKHRQCKELKICTELSKEMHIPTKSSFCEMKLSKEISAENKKSHPEIKIFRGDAEKMFMASKDTYSAMKMSPEVYYGISDTCSSELKICQGDSKIIPNSVKSVYTSEVKLLQNEKCVMIPFNNIPSCKMKVDNEVKELYTDPNIKVSSSDIKLCKENNRKQLLPKKRVPSYETSLYEGSDEKCFIPVKQPSTPEMKMSEGSSSEHFITLKAPCDEKMDQTSYQLCPVRQTISKEDSNVDRKINPIIVKKHCFNEAYVTKPSRENFLIGSANPCQYLKTTENTSIDICPLSDVLSGELSVKNKTVRIPHKKSSKLQKLPPLWSVSILPGNGVKLKFTCIHPENVKLQQSTDGKLSSSN